MRALALLLVAAAASAQADVSVDAPRAHATPQSPLGPACDAALAAAQARFSERASAVDFHVRQRRVVGEYHWSDMCGVWGDFTVELAPDHRAPLAWQWRAARSDEPDRFHRRGTRRANGWRARFVIDADSEGFPGDAFVEAFEPAIEACLASATASGSR